MQEVFETLTETGEDYAVALGKLNAYFKPQKNIPFERYTFRQAFQDPSETMDAYVTRIKRLVQTCDYGDSSEEMIRDLTLDVILRVARAMEASDRQAQKIEEDKMSENKVGSNCVNTTQMESHVRHKHLDDNASKQCQRQTGGRKLNHTCYCCGHDGHRAKDPSCPANNKSCNKCGKIDHFGRVCKSCTNPKQQQRAGDHSNIRQVQHRDEELSDNDEYVFTL